MAYEDFIRKSLEIANASPYIQAIKKPGRTIARLQYYVYGLNFVDVVDAATASASLETQADSDFALTYIAGGSKLAGNVALDYNVNVLCQIVDQSSGKPFFNQPTLMPLVAGAGGFPFLMTAPRVIDPNTTLTGTVTNRTGATRALIALALHGTRIFYV